MLRSMRRFGFLVLLALLVSAPVAASSFTYQGVLQDTGTATSGYDVEVRLFAVASDGTALASQSLASVPVQDAHFLLTLDFGPDAFSGDPRWLELAVRRSGEVGPYTILTPRQPVFATPYAQHAQDADFAASVAPGSVSQSEIDPTQVQRRVLGTCAVGSAVRVIAQDGSVSCESLVASAPAWLLGGNSGTDPLTQYLGTSDATAFEIRTHGHRNLRIEPSSVLHLGAPDSANVMAGSSSNHAWVGVRGATIGGGGLPHLYSDPELGIGGPNEVQGDFGTIGGGHSNLAGLQNGSASGYSFATVGGGRSNQATARSAVVAGGEYNMAWGPASSVGGGRDNEVSADSGSIGGGQENRVNGSNGTVAGGRNNVAQGSGAAIGGGVDNQAAENATIAGGLNHRARAMFASIGGGRDNTVDGQFAVIAGGELNQIPHPAHWAWIGGGRQNTVSAARASVGGGSNNTAGAANASVGGGLTNNASGLSATVAGGENNIASGEQTGVAAGRNNTAVGHRGFVGGGQNNSAAGVAAVVAGGSTNTASGFLGAIGGGASNVASGGGSAVIGGQSNVASGLMATAAGGENNCAGAPNSFAAGHRAKARPAANPGGTGACSGLASYPGGGGDDGSFVWADGNAHDFLGAGSNRFDVRATGGVRFVSAINASSGAPTAGVTLAAGGGAWANLSDRNAKAGIETVDPDAVLAGVLALPLYTWHYRSQNEAVRHMGPMAQDFHVAFGLNGEDDRHISSIDPDGVALAAIQGLYAYVKGREEADALRIAAFESEVSALRETVRILLEAHQSGAERGAQQ